MAEKKTVELPVIWDTVVLIVMSLVIIFSLLHCVRT